MHTRGRVALCERCTGILDGVWKRSAYFLHTSFWQMAFAALLGFTSRCGSNRVAVDMLANATADEPFTRLELVILHLKAATVY